MDTQLEKKLALVLFLCRLSVIIVILVWAIDKLMRPEHGAGIAGNFYGVKGLGTGVILATGVFQLIAIAAYLFGFMKRWVSLYMLVICAMPLFSPRLLKGFWHSVRNEPHPGILTFATFAVSACAFAVYYLRDYDTHLSLFHKRKA